MESIYSTAPIDLLCFVWGKAGKSVPVSIVNFIQHSIDSFRFICMKFEIIKTWYSVIYINWNEIPCFSAVFYTNQSYSLQLILLDCLRHSDMFLQSLIRSLCYCYKCTGGVFYCYVRKKYTHATSQEAGRFLQKTPWPLFQKVKTSTE